MLLKISQKFEKYKKKEVINFWMMNHYYNYCLP